MTTEIVPTTHELSGVTAVRVRNHRGDVTVTHRPAPVDGAPGEHGGAARVLLTPRADVDLAAATVSVENGTLVVDVPHLDTAGDGGGFRLGPITIGGAGVAVAVEVEVPSGTPDDLSTKFGDVRVEGTAGDARVRTGAGSVRVERCLRLECSTGAGDVRVGACTGGTATTGTGGVTVDSSEGALHARTGAGDVTVLASSGGAVSAVTGAGDVRLELLSGGCECRTGAGDVTVLVPRGEPVWLDLNAGLGSVRKDVEPVGAPAEGQPYLSVKARTGLGDVTVRHP
ncbi:DUF4097 family beta strand repeat-containing protein [Ornithinimicrobium pekingense]|uniref:DUF4097 domain-containing protein n=1 Tax=Ornithinimicrobium pekingense TaxID=384677 RepID=A0ABQ2FDQ2_9MICO|nr:DUF4097 family beta strand repeat-containing protein [Ornithinimicrobium pekingense]GGK82299.1 hypothetical protein GCM10011509_33550 [Ornithinimicrobium pekingense]